MGRPKGIFRVTLILPSGLIEVRVMESVKSHQRDMDSPRLRLARSGDYSRFSTVIRDSYCKDTCEFCKTMNYNSDICLLNTNL